MPTLTALLSTLERTGDASTLTIGDDWLQGRSAFGGLQAALAVDAMRIHCPTGMPLRTLQMTFVAPVPPGRVTARARLLRAGRNAMQVEARLVDDDATLALAVGVFGHARESQIQRMPQRPDVEPGPAFEVRHVPGVTPAFMQHFRARWVRGGVPFSGTPLPEAAVELAMHDEGDATEAHVLAMADFMPPVALSMLSLPAPASSLTWMLEFPGGADAPAPLHGWRIDAQMIAAGGDGYLSQSTQLWKPDGTLAVLGSQTMVVFG